MPDYYVRNEFPVTTIIEDEEGKALDDDAIDAAIDKAIVDHDMNKLVDYVLEGGVDKLKDKVPIISTSGGRGVYGCCAYAINFLFNTSQVMLY